MLLLTTSNTTISQLVLVVILITGIYLDFNCFSNLLDGFINFLQVFLLVDLVIVIAASLGGTHTGQ